MIKLVLSNKILFIRYTTGEMIIISELYNFLVDFLNIDTVFSGKSAEQIANNFTSFAQFMNFTESDFQELRKPNGHRITNLSSNLHSIISSRRNYVDPKKTVKENHILCAARGALRKILDNVDTLTLDDLNPNPFLIKILKQKRLKYFAYYCWLLGFVVAVLNLGS